MLFTRDPDPPQIRYRCRNPRCGAKLEVPTSDRRSAFCCKGCERQFYARHCRVCEGLFSPKTSRRIVCSKEKCRSRYKRHPEQYELRLSSAKLASKSGPRCLDPQNDPLAHNEPRSAHSTGLKSDLKSGRGWRIIAGPTDLHPINLRAFPADAAALRTGRPNSTLIRRDTPPVNIVGGYRFPNAPKVDLFEEPATSTEPEGTR